MRSANEELVTLSNPVRPGDTLTIFATGLGRTVPEVESGVASPSDPLAQAAAIPTVSIGGTRLPVDFAGLSPELVGVYAIVVSVPDTVPEGMEMPLVISQGAYSTTMPVRVVKP